MTFQTFRTPEARVDWFSRVVLSTVPDPRAPLRILDLGCGAGDQVFDLARHLPLADFLGIDISVENIALAEARRRTSTEGSRIAFIADDIRALSGREPFDLVFSFSVLYLVPGERAAIADTIAALVATGGIFVNAMPRRCPHNRLLSGFRHLLRAVRSSRTDAALLQIARMLHGDLMPVPLLEERIAYAYLPPFHYEEDVADALEQRGFITCRRGGVPHASPAQLKHGLRIMQRTAEHA